MAGQPLCLVGRPMGPALIAAGYWMRLDQSRLKLDVRTKENAQTCIDAIDAKAAVI
jgi:hypothetical protein